MVEQAALLFWFWSLSVAARRPCSFQGLKKQRQKKKKAQPHQVFGFRMRKKSINHFLPTTKTNMWPFIQTFIRFIVDSLVIDVYPVDQAQSEFIHSLFTKLITVGFTFSLFLVTLKKSSMRVCLVHPAVFSCSRSSRLVSRIWRNFSIRWRTLFSLKHMNTVQTIQTVACNMEAKQSLDEYLICLSWQRNLTKASSSGSDQVRSGAAVCGASRNIFRASLYFHSRGTGWVCRTADCIFNILKEQQGPLFVVSLYLSVDMQKHILNSMVLLD